MKNGPNSSISIRKRIIKKYEEGLWYIDISRELIAPLSTFRNIVRKYKNFKGLLDIPRPDSPRKTTKRQDTIVKRKSIADPKKTSRDIVNEMFDEYELKLNQSTIKRWLADVGLNASVPVKKPFISRKNRIARLKFAKYHEHWDINDWKNIL